MDLIKSIFFVFLILVSVFGKAQDTLTVMAYNILNYPSSNASKADTLKPIIQLVQPDIFMITELTSFTGVSMIMNNALNLEGVTSYQNATYFNGPDTDNMLFYNTDKLVLYSQYEIPTALRNISEYVLYYKTAGMMVATDTVFIYCYMAHLKASTGAINEQKRNQEAILLKNYMDSRTGLENVIFGGDFNFYSSLEPAHNTVLNGGSVTLLDPISSPGNWSNNSSFASTHTQSTRSNALGDGGSYGGMDDRFDFIFFSEDLQTGANDLTYVSGSYNALGNDGNHFNKSINATPSNSAVSVNMANALYIMSDHLPVVLKAAIPINVSVKENQHLRSWKGYLVGNYFNFKSSKNEKELTVFVYDVLGKTIQKTEHNNTIDFNLKLTHFNSGLYFVKVVSESKQESFKIFKR
jgi:hypothetical protein